eukprot:6196750-Pleurochrysis_carterae.AAC.4
MRIRHQTKSGHTCGALTSTNWVERLAGMRAKRLRRLTAPLKPAARPLQLAPLRPEPTEHSAQRGASGQPLNTESVKSRDLQKLTTGGASQQQGLTPTTLPLVHVKTNPDGLQAFHEEHEEINCRPNSGGGAIPLGVE